jgi:hypothetical protein
VLVELTRRDGIQELVLRHLQQPVLALTPKPGGLAATDIEGHDHILPGATDSTADLSQQDPDRR